MNKQVALLEEPDGGLAAAAASKHGFKQSSTSECFFKT